MAMEICATWDFQTLFVDESCNNLERADPRINLNIAI
jgi:hypothetical protein